MNGNLHGFHLPSPAKRLFRAFPSSDSQPWPNDEFRESSRTLALSLHEILVAIVGKLKEMSKSNGNQQYVRSQVSQQLGHKINERSRKRKWGSDESNGSEPTVAVEMTAPVFQTTKCPLDYFFYHNRDPHQVNCTEHVDRGALIAVCLSSASSGLEVLHEDSFVCPEACLIHLKNLYGERKPVSGLICIMAGDQLAGLIGSKERLACVHRVRNNLTRARLSISYELRLL